MRRGCWVLLCFFGVAGLSVLLGADLLAGVQVLLYVGGVVVLILFAILVTNKIRDANVSSDVRPGSRVPALVLSWMVFFVLVSVYLQLPWGGGTGPMEPTTASVGESLLTTYLLPFEAVSVLLLAALVGAAILVRKEVRPEPDEAAADAERLKEGTGPRA